MSRRRQAGDQDFGSDSFLDIIANIVGILIILIVIAGMKVARQPLNVATQSSSTEIVENEHPVVQPIPTDVPDEEGTIQVPVDEPSSAETLSTRPAVPVEEALDQTDDSENTQIAERVAADLNDEIEADNESARERQELEERLADTKDNTKRLQAEINDAQLELADLRQQLSARKLTEEFSVARRDAILQESRQVQEELDGVQDRLNATIEESETVKSTLAKLTKRQKYVTEALKQIAFETRRLSEVLQNAPKPTEPADRIRHRISPVSQSVSTKEEHFRLAEGRIVHVPISALLERLRSQIGQRTGIVRRFRRSEGLVGPVGGFRMQYVVERQSADPLRALQYGQSGYRISVSRWTIVPAETLNAEPVDDALRIGSRFRQVLEALPVDTVLTIWLYPNDFESFAKIRQLGHRLNLRVAARPLPDGVPIAASPNGSQSASQ